MKPLAVAGLLLIVVGIAGLALGRFSYTTEKKVIDLGPITASVDEKHNIDIPDVAGIAALPGPQERIDEHPTSGGTPMNMANDAETKADFDAVATDLAMLKRDVAALMSQLKSGAVRGAKEAAEDTLDQLSERASRLYDKVAEQGARSTEALSRQVEEQPIASLLIAFGVGFIVSRLLSR